MSIEIWDKRMETMKQIKEIQLTREIIEIMQQKALKDYAYKPIKRSAHTKTLAVLNGELTIDAQIPSKLKKGIFAKPDTYPVWIRISNSSNKPKDDSKKDVRGLAIQMMYEGELQDFILASTKHMPLRTLRGFHGAVSLVNRKNILQAMIELIQDINLTQLFKLATTRVHETSPLDIPYFSITPYALEDYAVKYMLRPTSTYTSQKPLNLTPTYLRDNMTKHLAQQEATFDVMIQVARAGLKVEDSSEEWDEWLAPPIKVGTLHIPPQVFDTTARIAYGEALTFSPAHASDIHRPLGSLNRARAMIYKEMQHFRKRS